MAIEKYGKLAFIVSFPIKYGGSPSPWFSPNFYKGQAFVRSLPKHSLVADLGCGSLEALEGMGIGWSEQEVL